MKVYVLENGNDDHIIGVFDDIEKARNMANQFDLSRWRFIIFAVEINDCDIGGLFFAKSAGFIERIPA